MRKSSLLTWAAVSLATGCCFLTSCGTSNSASKETAEVKRPRPNQSLAQESPALAIPAPQVGVASKSNPATLRSAATGESEEANSNTATTSRIAPRTPGNRLGNGLNAAAATNSNFASEENSDATSSETTSADRAPPGRPLPNNRFAGSSEPEISISEMLKVKPTDKTGLEPGDSILEIVGKDMEAHQMSLSDYRGQVVMLDFWGDW